MLYTLENSPFSPRQLQAMMYIGLGTILIVGSAACIALVLALLYLIVHLALLTVQCVVETLTTIGSTYAAADPTIKFFMLLVIGYILYTVYLKVTRKEATR